MSEALTMLSEKCAENDHMHCTTWHKSSLTSVGCDCLCHETDREFIRLNTIRTTQKPQEYRDCTHLPYFMPGTSEFISECYGCGVRYVNLIHPVSDADNLREYNTFYLTADGTRAYEVYRCGWWFARCPLNQFPEVA